MAFAGVGDGDLGLANPDNADDVFAALGPTVFGDSALGKVFEMLLIISVLTSASASTQTTILPDRPHGALDGRLQGDPAQFAKDPPAYLTPSVATIWMGMSRSSSTSA